MKRAFLSIALAFSICTLMAQSISVWQGEGELAGISFSYDRTEVGTVENPRTGTKFTKYKITTILVNGTDKDVLAVVAGTSSLHCKFVAKMDKLSEADRVFCSGQNNTGIFHGQLCKVNILCNNTTVQDIPKHILCPLGELPEVSYLNIRVESLQPKPSQTLEPSVTYNPNGNRPEEKVSVRVPQNTKPDAGTVLPSYPGGTQALYAMFGQNVKYPRVDLEKGVQGRVSISFVVEKDGSLTDFKIESAPSTTLGEEALRVLKLTGNWIPGSFAGKPVRVRHIIPVNFRF